MLACVAALLISVFPGDSTRPRPFAQLVHTRWMVKDGAPADIRALAQTGDGYLWLGAEAGLFRFDGVRFVQFTPRAGDSLPAAGVSRLKAMRDGSLWIVWSNGSLSHLRDGRTISYGERDGLPATFDITESSRGTVITGTAKGLSHFTDGKWEELGLPWGREYGWEARAVWFDRNDVLWVQTNSEIVYRLDGTQEFVTPRMIIRDRSSLAVFAQEPDGTVWINELARSAHTLRLVGDTTFASEVRVRATSVLIDRKGSLWVGSSGDGLRRVHDPTRIRARAIRKSDPEAEAFTMKDGLLSDIVSALLEDREGNVWVASAAGVERFREGAFTPIASPGTARSRFVFAARDTSLWTAAQDMTGLLRIGPRDSATVATNFPITTLTEDSAGRIYTVRNASVYILGRNGFAPLPIVVADNVFTLANVAVHPNGTVWLFDEDAGLAQVHNGRFRRVAALDERVARRGGLFIDRTGRVWVGQLNRVALYDGEQLTLFGAEQGVPQGLIFQVMEDRVGNIWVAGEGGISRFAGGRFSTIANGRDLPGGTVYGIAEDDSAAWWVVTRTSVLRLSPGEADRALADSTYVLRYRTFDDRDGLRGMVTAGWGLPVARTLDGRIWVATDGGVASVDPRRLPSESAPPVLIEAARIDGREISPSETAPISLGRGDLEIDYTAINLAMPERIQFRYRLEGADRTWQEAGTRRRASYSRLAPGDYRFRVAARNGDGVWGDESSPWTFRVLPPWYQTAWFMVAMVIVIGALGAAATALVQRNRHTREREVLKQQYEATLAERGRIAQDLHDSLLQGFVGVTLQLKAAENALPENSDAARETIHRVQRLARESLREARDRVWDLHQTNNGSGDLPTALEAVARERASGTGIEISLGIIGKRRPLERRLEDAAFRMGREAIANAIRHAEARRIDIIVQYRESSVGVEVRDDGRGFSLEEADEAHRQGHFGLSGIRERAAAMGGHCDVTAPPEGGTVIALELPSAETPSGGSGHAS